MVQVENNTNTLYSNHFKAFENNLNGEKDSPLHQIRRNALNHFEELGFPNTRNEDWKYTNIKPIASQQFEPVFAPKPHSANITAKELEAFSLPAMKCSRLVFVNGHYVESLSSLLSLPKGTEIGDLSQFYNTSETLSQHITKYASPQKDAFTALNTAFLQRGTYLSLPENTIIEDPIFLLFLSTKEASPFISHPRNLFVLGKGSQAKVIEGYFGYSDATYCTNAVTEIVLQENAILDYSKIQQESEQAFHIGNTQVYQKRDSCFTSNSISFGAAIGRHSLNIELDGEGVECNLNGLYFARGKQLLDNHTFINHAKPNGTSSELYKGILTDQAHAVFNGRILVAQDSQKTNSQQTNKNLLLSENATIDTKPQLEIFADDVKCAHGATVGQMEKSALFYLRSRGIGIEEARYLLTYAFAADILQKISIAPLQKELDKILWSYLK